MKRTEEIAKIACPHCGGFFSRVLESDPAQDGLTIHRTRLCLGCQRRYVTAERTISVPADEQSSTHHRVS